MIGNAVAKLIEDWWQRVTSQRGVPAGAIRDQVAPGVLPPATSTDRGAVVLSNSTPATIGTAAAGSAATVARSDHVHGQQSHNHTSAGNDGGVLTNDEHDGYSVYIEISAPSAPEANTLRLYAKDTGGVTELFYKNSAGAERDLSVATGGSGNAISAGVVGSEPGSPASGDLYFETNGFAIERYGSAWARWGPIYQITAPPTSGWSWVNQGGATVDTANGGIYLLAPAGSGDNLRLYARNAPSTPYTITAMVLPHHHKVNYNQIAVCWRESSSGKIVGFQIDQNLQFTVTKWTNPTTFSAPYVTGIEPSMRSPIWLRIADNGTDRICSWSADGQHFHQFHSVGRTDFLTADQVGIYATSSNATYPAALTLLSWT